MADFRDETIGGVTIKIPEKGFASEETLEALVKALKTGKGPAGDINPVLHVLLIALKPSTVLDTILSYIFDIKLLTYCLGVVIISFNLCSACAYK